MNETYQARLLSRSVVYVTCLQVEKVKPEQR